MKRPALKVMTILGTRPEIIRLSRVMAALDKAVDHVTVHTGQNYDYELNDVFFSELKIRKPDHFLGVKSNSLGGMIGNIISSAEAVMMKVRPDAVLILGDTNSSMAGIMAKRLKIPLFHMEAGNRCYDLNVPEEINRRIIDHISDINLVYTEHARRNLLREGMHPRFIYVTGSPMREVLDHYLPGVRRSSVLRKLGLRKQAYFIASIHREENVDNSANLRNIVRSLNGICEDYKAPVIVATHPRTRKRVDELRGIAIDKRIRFLKPFGFFDYVNLQMNALCALSDSGTISEESSMLNFPAATLRNAIERPEAMDTGSIMMTGLEPDVVRAGVDMLVRERRTPGHTADIPADYRITNTSERVVKIIMSLARHVYRWQGIVARN